MRAWKSITITFATSSTLVLAGLASPALASDDDHHGSGNTVLVQDRCDPATFNAAVGPGTCVATGRHHPVTFQKFVSRLATDPARVLRESNNRGWTFDPVTLTIKTGTHLLAKNTGGEAHTFTPVSAFGGGCVPFLNAPLGLTLNPICPTSSTAPLPGLVLPGTTLTIKNLLPGTYRYECLIHPWMRTTVTVSNTVPATTDDDGDND
jgi:plastocyanin